MPEGDTIHRSARQLARALCGRPLDRYWAYRPELLQPDRTGKTVASVEARGKNLLIHFTDGRALYTHMKMTGSWHIYRPGERWQLPEHLGRLVLGNAEYVAVCFSAPDIELLTAPDVQRHPVLSALGPDLLGESFDVDEALARLRKDLRSLAEALLDQRIVAGIGNVWKSEMLFLRRLDPFQGPAAYPDDVLRSLFLETRALMQQNLETRHRITRSAPGSDLWVYRRNGERCFRCGRSIQTRAQGEPARTTYYCARCQRVDEGPAREAG